MNQIQAGIVAPHRELSKSKRALPLAGGSQGMQFNAATLSNARLCTRSLSEPSGRTTRLGPLLPEIFSYL
jgi:hypothetical protein